MRFSLRSKWTKWKFPKTLWESIFHSLFSLREDAIASTCSDDCLGTFPPFELESKQEIDSLKLNIHWKEVPPPQDWITVLNILRPL